MNFNPKKVRIPALRKARRYVAQVLDKLKDQDQFRDIAMDCDINPPRITEAFTDVSMSESTLKKLLRGGKVDLNKMLKAVDFTTPEAKYLKSLLSNSQDISESATLTYDVGFTTEDIAAAIAALRSKDPQEAAKKIAEVMERKEKRDKKGKSDKE